MTNKQKAKLIAFYLPQYHPIPENNHFWGEGFTEWNNVAKARPRFEGHHQPQIPKDLGFYDLRLKETRKAQAKMAQEHGISAFCYYSYFLNEKNILHTPLELEFNEHEEGIPICLCWANENWTRAWDGREQEILLEQKYDSKSLENYMDYLIEKFSHPRYLKHNDRPVFLIYSPDHIPSEINFLETLQNKAATQNIKKPYILAVKHGRALHHTKKYLEHGYEGVVSFQPNQKNFPKSQTTHSRLKNLARSLMPRSLYKTLARHITSYQAIDYRKMIENIIARPFHPSEIACIFPSWDNTPRRSISTVIQNEDPALFGKWLAHELTRLKSNKTEHNMVFINAWNEWAEGCHLEPDEKNGLAFLREIKSQINKAEQ